MTDLEAFTAAYMAACKDRPSDWNEIGYWYARQLWDAAIKHEREACAKACEEVLKAGDVFKDYEDNHEDGHTDGCNNCAAAIRARLDG